MAWITTVGGDRASRSWAGTDARQAFFARNPLSNAVPCSSPAHFLEQDLELIVCHAKRSSEALLRGPHSLPTRTLTLELHRCSSEIDVGLAVGFLATDCSKL